MSQETKIDSVKISIKGRTIDMSIDELRELRNILCEAFPVKDEFIPYYTQPIIIEKRENPWEYWWQPYITNPNAPSTTDERIYWVECKS